MFRLSRSQILPIGLDIGQHSVKLLQAEIRGESLVIRGAASAQLSPEATVSPEKRLESACELIGDLLASAKFAGRRVVAALPREWVHVKNFRLPQMPMAELEGAVPLEARNLLPFDADEAQIRFLVAGEVRQGNDVVQEVIVLAARNEQVDRFVEIVHEGGVVLDAIDILPCALYRSVQSFMRRREDEVEVNVLVDVGLRATHVVIGKGGEISFVKAIDIGGIHFQEAVSRKLGIPLAEARDLRRRLADALMDAGPGRASAALPQNDPVRQAVSDSTRAISEQLAREISLCLRYHSVTFRGQRPSRVRVFGGESADPQLRGIFNSVLTIPVEAGRPLHNVETSGAQNVHADAGGEWAVPLGLSLKGTHQRFAARDGRSRDSLIAARLGAPMGAPETDPTTEMTPIEPAREEAAHA